MKPSKCYLFSNFYLCSVLSTALTTSAFAVDAPDISISTPKVAPKVGSVSYDVDGVLLYSDSFRGLSRSAMIDTPQPSRSLDEASTTNTGGYRTLGMKHLKLGLEWLNPRRMRAFILVRPDAVGSDGKIRREMDTRSGSTTSPASEIRLLDLYELSILREGMTFSVGVRDRLVPSYKAYEDILEFGVEARDPRKSFGVFLELPQMVQLSDDSAFSFYAAVIGAPDDRRLDRSTSTESGDEAPSQASPYWGGIVGLGFQAALATKIGIAASLNEEKITDGRITHTFYEAGVTRQFAVASHDVRLGVDVRQSKDEYKTEGSQYAQLVATSAAFTSSIEAFQNQHLLLGFRFGSGGRRAAEDTSRALTTKGFQLETGLRTWFGEGMEGTALITKEWRKDQTLADTQVGGFGTQQRSTISRIAIQLAYRTGGSL